MHVTDSFTGLDEVIRQSVMDLKFCEEEGPSRGFIACWKHTAHYSYTVLRNDSKGL